MKLIRFNVHEDLEHINAWLSKHTMPPVTRLDLPEMGYMAWERGKPVAAIFMRRAEGSMGIVDSLISNPEAAPDIRHLALDALINHIVEQAKRAKIKVLLGYTRDKSTLERSVRLGFAQSPFAIVVMDPSKHGDKI